MSEEVKLVPMPPPAATPTNEVGLGEHQFNDATRFLRKLIIWGGAIGAVVTVVAAVLAHLGSFAKADHHHPDLETAIQYQSQEIHDTHEDVRAILMQSIYTARATNAMEVDVPIHRHSDGGTR